MKKVIVVGSGPFNAEHFEDFLKDIEDPLFIGVDLGALRLLQLNHPLRVAIGDFDSIQEAEVITEIEEKADDFYRYPSEKDETDGDTAFRWILNQNYEDYDVYAFGMLGGRLDHLLHNLWMAYDPYFKPILNHLHYIDDTTRVDFLFPGEHTLMKPKGSQFLSFVAMKEVHNLTYIGAKYPLNHYDMPYLMALSSNEFLGEEMTVRFDSGLLMALTTRDKND